MAGHIHNKISVLNNVVPIILQDAQKTGAKDLKRTIENLFIIAYNTSFSIAMIGQHTNLLNHIFVHQFRDKFRLQATPITEKPDTAAQKADDNQDGLKAQVVNNYTPICASPFNPTVPLYEPKTIIAYKNLKAYLKTQKQQDNVLKSLNEIANMSHEDHGKHIEKYMQARRITAKDCKKEKLPSVLIGQNGVYAARDIPAFTVLGYYSGIYFTNSDDLSQYAVQNGLAFKTYMFSFPDVSIPRVSAYLHGNNLSLVNAATIYSGTAYTIAREIAEKCNLTVIYAKSLEYPNAEYVNDPNKYDLVAYASNRDIKKGEQLYVNYGMNYWRNRNDNFTTATEEEIQDMMNYFYEKRIKKEQRR